MRILVIEDDKALAEVIAAVLNEEKYIVDEALAGDEGLYKAKQGIYDLLVLDIMLPEINGLDIIQSLRSAGSTVPILLLTARDSVKDRVLGLESGADDYLVKPFAILEFLARVKALLRRTGSLNKEGELSYSNVHLDQNLRDAAVNGHLLGLTAKEYEVLEFLILNKEHILTREQIFDRIWGFESDTTLNIVDLYIHYLRKKLAVYNSDSLIHTIRGAGFMLKEK